MPVSNPSYFPDQRGNGSIVGITAGQLSTGANCFLAGTNAGRASTVNDLIVIGNNAATAGVTDANLAGSIVIGVGSIPSLSISAGDAFPVTLLGANNLVNVSTPVDSLVVIGSGNLNGASADPLKESVVIGNNIWPTASIFPVFNENVIIGQNINFTPGGTDSIASGCIMIGSALFNSSQANQFTEGVYIGTGMELINDESICPGNVCIGAAHIIPSGANSENNVMIGVAMSFAGSTGSANTVIGGGNDWGGSGNVIIGVGAKAPELPADATYGCVIIGNNAGNSISGSVTLNHVFLIEAAQGASGGAANPLALLYGSFANGDLVLGQSSDGTNRDLQGTNTVKLLNGTIGGANPIGGGYFYVVAGALHWVGSAGSDTVVAPA